MQKGSGRAGKAEERWGRRSDTNSQNGNDVRHGHHKNHAIPLYSESAVIDPIYISFSMARPSSQSAGAAYIFLVHHPGTI